MIAGSATDLKGFNRSSLGDRMVDTTTGRESQRIRINRSTEVGRIKKGNPVVAITAGSRQDQVDEGTVAGRATLIIESHRKLKRFADHGIAGKRKGCDRIAGCENRGCRQQQRSDQQHDGEKQGQASEPVKA